MGSFVGVPLGNLHTSTPFGGMRGVVCRRGRGLLLRMSAGYPSTGLRGTALDCCRRGRVVIGARNWGLHAFLWYSLPKGRQQKNTNGLWNSNLQSLREEFGQSQANSQKIRKRKSSLALSRYPELKSTRIQFQGGQGGFRAVWYQTHVVGAVFCPS